MDRARHALSNCQENFLRAEQQFSNELVSYEKLKNLASLGADRGGEWKAWAGSMKDAIEQGRQPIEETSRALAACWQELVERSGTTSISVTNTGQKIIARRMNEEAVRERTT
jgi:predicted secreted protein